MNLAHQEMIQAIAELRYLNELENGVNKIEAYEHLAQNFNADTGNMTSKKYRLNLSERGKFKFDKDSDYLNTVVDLRLGIGLK